MSPRDKEAKFVELANRRVNRAIKDIRLIGNLANRRNYIYSDDQARKIIKILQKEIESIRRSFEDHQGGAQDEFTL
jgi:hypothetical protein